ncbi:unnamed protein product [Brassica napus]|uniref:thioglucosidase n=1 Tax=Brassica napus TaxID=3708 RepID=A0A816T8I1_BRANA|nr:unnamed protein product [Brassica napus]
MKSIVSRERKKCISKILKSTLVTSYFSRHCLIYYVFSIIYFPLKGKKIYAAKNSFGRSNFPEGFLFGTASSAYQYEGAVNDASRGLSVWDTFVRKHPERNCYSHADQAVEFYHHYKEDIQRMKDINMDSFRFSISWPRLFPHGKKSKGVNKEGIKFYNDLIDELLANGITPLATLFHWDTPQALEDEYNGFLSEKAVDDFRDFATICFEEFGDRVKYWVTLNEPWVYSIGGYDTGRKAPGRASNYMNEAALAGESGLEVYTVSHNLLLAHAEAVEVFRNNPKCKDGKIGIAHCPVWFEPYDSNCPDDHEAVERAMEFMFGWHMDPTVYGDYPQVMKRSIGKRLPSFTAAQSQKLKGSFDFVGVNYYSAFYVKNVTDVDHNTPNWRSDACIEWKKQNKAGEILGPRGGSEWDFLYPQGLRKFLNHAKNKYGSPKFMITENGHCDIDYEKKAKLSNLMDLQRTEYHEKHLQSIHQAIKEDGVQVEGYYAWSLLDNCEWNAGYGVRYGLFYVDYNNGLKRYPKMSAMWFKEFLKKEEIEDSEKEGLMLNSLVNKKRKRFLTSSGIKPFATIFHWDTPQSLEDAYGGFRGAEIVNDFRDYADICFKNFGDRVKHWMTLNEPLTVVQQGYVAGGMAPGRCSNFTNPSCTGGDGATEPYIVGHNLLLAHGAAVKVYREKYKASQKGQVGIALSAGWYLPYTESAADRLAAARIMAFTFDYFLEPLVTGKYPVDMVNNVKGGRLPTFTAQQSKMLKGSSDFIGINYYSSAYAKDVPCPTEYVTLFSDPCASVTGEREGVPIGPKAGSDWLLIYPKGIRDLILYAKYKFKDPVIYITENGRDEIDTGKRFLKDGDRIDFYARHLEMVKDAISIGANMKGFFAWSLLDNFEWAAGYTARFGIVYVDFKDGCKRYPKKSADWFKKFLNPKKSN